MHHCAVIEEQTEVQNGALSFFLTVLEQVLNLKL